jgi:hypothetical protein
LQSVADIKSAEGEDLTEVREAGLKVARKALFSILARCKHNSGMKQIVEVMCEIFTAQPNLAVDFLDGILKDPEEFGEIMLEATDNTSRMYIAHLMKFLLC